MRVCKRTLKNMYISRSICKAVGHYPIRFFFFIFYFYLFNKNKKKEEKGERGEKKRIKAERRIKWEKRSRRSLQMCQALPRLPQQCHSSVFFVLYPIKHKTPMSDMNV